MNSVIREGKTGCVVVDPGPPAFARAICDFVSKPHDEKESVDSIRASVRRFNWPNVAGAMIKEYESMIDEFNFSNMPKTSSKAAVV